jgi:hypothetical protein
MANLQPDRNFAILQPNRYLLQGQNGIPKVDYLTHSFFGPPILSLTLGSPTSPARVFTGSQIRVVSTEIGDLVTVTTEISIDTGSTSFSVLIPSIGLKNASDHEAFNTEAIIATHSGPLSLPSTGPHEKYHFVPLKGEASFIFTLIESVLAPLAAVKA